MLLTVWKATWSRVRGLALGVSLLAVLATVPTTARADVCDPSCDAECQTCCKVWSLTAVCSDGSTVGETGSFATQADATTAAGTTAPPGAPCSDRSAPRWKPYCAPENGVASPVDVATMGNLVALRASIGQSRKLVADTQAALATFAEKRIILKAGVARVAAAAATLRQARSALDDALLTATLLRARGNPTDADVSSADQGSQNARTNGAAAAKSAQDLMADPSIIDAPAEARAAKAAAAAAAAKAAQDARLAAIEEQKARAAAAAAAAAGAASAAPQQRADDLRAKELSALDDAEKKRADVAATLATFMARTDVFPQARKVGDVLTQRLADQQTKIAAQRVKVDGTSSAAPEAAMATLNGAAAANSALALEVGRTGADVKALTSSPWNVAKAGTVLPAPAGAPAPPPAPVPPPVAAIAPAPHAAGPLVPSCEIAFTPKTPGITLAVDHGNAVPLPAKVHVSSGRHVLTIRHGSKKADKKELLLCGHIDAFPVEAP